MSNKVVDGIVKAIAITMITFAAAIAAMFIIDLLVYLPCSALGVDDYHFGVVVEYALSFSIALLPFVFYNVGFGLLIIWDYLPGWFFRGFDQPPGRNYNPPFPPLPGDPTSVNIVGIIPVFRGVLVEGKKKARSFFNPRAKVSELYICEI